MSVYNISCGILDYVYDFEFLSDENIKNLCFSKIINNNIIVPKLNIPIVLVGGHSRAYKKELSNIFDSEIVVPKYAKICNSIGAVVGYVYKKIECMIKVQKLSSRYRLQPNGIFAYINGKRYFFEDYETATDFVEKKAIEEINEYMEYMQVSKKDIIINKKVDFVNSIDLNIPLITNYIFEGFTKIN